MLKADISESSDAEGVRQLCAAGNVLFHYLVAGYVVCSVAENSVGCTLMSTFLYVCYN